MGINDGRPEAGSVVGGKFMFLHVGSEGIDIGKEFWDILRHEHKMPEDHHVREGEDDGEDNDAAEDDAVAGSPRAIARAPSCST